MTLLLKRRRKTVAAQLTGLGSVGVCTERVVDRCEPLLLAAVETSLQTFVLLLGRVERLFESVANSLLSLLARVPLGSDFVEEVANEVTPFSSQVLFEEDSLVGEQCPYSLLAQKLSLKFLQLLVALGLVCSGEVASAAP